MSQLNNIVTIFGNNDLVTAAKLNSLVTDTTLTHEAVTDQTVSTGTLAGSDVVLGHQVTADALVKIPLSTIRGNAALGPVAASAIDGVASADIVITPQSGQKVDVNGPLEANSINCVGASTVGGNQSITGNLSVTGEIASTGTGAMKLPVGTTVQRPATPVAGQMRYNSTLDQAEVYSGSEWKAVGGVPFDASGGTVTTVDGFKIHTFTTSGTFTPALNREGKIEYLIVGAGGAGSTASPQGGGGGGGGDVKTGFLSIARNTAPMAVTVGSGASGNGTPSSFAGITCNGGTSGSWRTGGNSGSGFVGGGPSDGGGAGGGARSTEISPRGNNIGGFGGRGVGSFISGSYREYGGGGSGSGGGNGSTSGFNAALTPEGIYGGGGRSVAPVANSGGGGGGGCTGVTATLGADGVVVIRYRVS